MLLIIEQILNGLQLGVTLFLMSAGLTLIFGIMQVINLAHGSFYMIGAYVGATVTAVAAPFCLDCWQLCLQQRWLGCWLKL
jgi:branched-chain amino acid transport system permease protein